jgi:intracellular multiplication protein IcmP
MLAVMALHHAHKRSEAIALLGDLAESLPKAKRDGRAGPEKTLSFPAEVVARADGYLSDKSVVAPVLEVMGRHFFTTAGLMSVLCEARLRGGVLAPAQFAFLKLVDRRLWYALHSLGFEIDGPRAHPHPSQRIEAIGARDHWAAERLAGRPLPAPSVDRAIKAIRLSYETVKPAASGRG